ncbi:tyrocidine synthetase 1 [Apodospora peruviana]|uniref:Tyrocidine synthetase 1 n=1 Tax=Apodospora peruviana TaxID=516989 RepID=A0AAE0M7Z0_9PEZI|nr:tyrocidine synthetase 1 [Apodospora peruviana]
MKHTHGISEPPFHAGLRGTIWEIFQQVAAHGPENTALEYEQSEAWTYSQLHEAASHLAHQLEQLVPFGQYVPVMLPRSPAQVVAILALAKIGAVYVPLDPDLPSARIEKLLASIPSAIVLCLARQAKDDVPSGVSTVVVTVSGKHLTAESGLLQQQIPHQTAQRTSRFTASEDDIASVLFTSGSTGQAKGVKLTHRNLILPARLLAEKENIGPKSRVFQFARSSFDVHLIDILCAFLHGAQLLQVSQESLMTDVSGWMHRMEADTVHLTPSTISMMEPAQIPSLKYMVTCGEPVTPDIINRWGPKVVLTNLYGPCEASSVVSKALQPGDDPSSVGIPSPYASIVVASPNGEVSPAGAAGEILVKGGSVCKGYFNADSRSRFLEYVDDHGYQIPGPWYLTGDHGYFGVSGELHLLGREDDQVKINGQRVELGDIEAVVKNHAARAVVLAHTIGGQKRLFAIVSSTIKLAMPNENVEIDENGTTLSKTIFGSCKTQLPSYMIPRILVVKLVPQSPSGKIDVQKIRNFISSLHQIDAVYNSTQSRNKETLSQKIQRLVNERIQQQVPPKDNLFEWGFTSLDAIYLIRAIFDASGRRIQFRDLMQSPTIEGVSRLAETAASDANAIATPTSTSPGTTYSPTIQQESLYHASKLFGHKTYVCPFAFRITGHLDVKKFLSAVEYVYGCHDAFNTSFEEDAFGAADSFLKAHVRHRDFWRTERTSFLPFEETRRIISADATEHGNNERDAVSAILARERRSVDAEMDLQTHPPAWMTLYQLDSPGGKWLPVFKFHHLVIDRHSFHRFWSDVVATYHQGALPAASKVSYSQFAQLQRNQVLARHDRDLKWWSEQAKSGSLPQNLFPQYSESGQEPTAPTAGFCESSIHWHELPAQNVSQFLHDWKSTTTAFGAWLGLSQLFLHRLTGANHFLLGVPTSLRGTHPLFADVVGYCLSLAVVPVSIPVAENMESFFSSAVGSYWDCVEHDQAVGDVLQCFQVAGQGEAPRISVHFAYQDQQDDKSLAQMVAGAPFVYKALVVPSRGSHYDLVVHLDESTTPSRVGFEYRNQVFTEQSVRNMALLFEETLQKIVAGGRNTAVRSLAVSSPPHPCRNTASENSVKPVLATEAPPCSATGPDQTDSSLLDILCQCWIDILCPGTTAAELDPHRSFFKSGGDSISVIRFCAKARSRGVVGCTIGVVYSNPTLAGLSKAVHLKDSPTKEAKALGENQPNGPKDKFNLDKQLKQASPPSIKTPSDPVINKDCIEAFMERFPAVLDEKAARNVLLQHNIIPTQIENIYPPTAMQAAMASHSSTNSGAYVSQIILHVEGPIDSRRLNNAWRDVVDAHPSLRTVFVPTTSLDVSDSLPFLAVELNPHIDGTSFLTVDKPMLPAEFEAYLTRDREAGFALATKTSSRLTLVENYPEVEKHRLVMTCNHATIDGWSMGKLMSDLQSAYGGLSLQPGHSFSVFVADRMNRQMKPAIDFWQASLKSVHVPDLESSYCKNVGTSDKGIIRKTPSQLITGIQLRQAASQLQVTPFTILQAAFSLALAPLQHQQESATNVLFWATTSGRGTVDGDTEAVGNFLNSIPCVVRRPDGEITVSQWLRYQQATFQKSVEFDYLAVSEMMRFLNPPDAKINALLVFENHAGAEGTALSSNTRVAYVEGREFSDLPFTAVVQPGEEDLYFTVKYNRSKIPAGTARRVLDSLVAAVEAIVHCVQTTSPNFKVMELNITNFDYAEMTHAEQQVESVRTITEMQHGQDTLVSMFKTAAAKFRTSPALSTVSLVVSFEQLDRMSDQVASHLVAHTDNRNGLVPILFEKSVFMVVAMLAVLKAGRAYCPLDWDSPSTRLDELVRKLGASAILSSSRGFSKLGMHTCQSLQVIDIESILYMPDGTNDGQVQFPAVTPGLPCYVMFTSGSTGQPKAAVLTHRAVASSVRQAIQAYNLEPSSRVLLFANYVFDASITDIYGSLLSGATLVLPSDDELKTDLAASANAHRINWLHVTPTILKLVKPTSIPGLKTVVLGGEPILAELARNWRQHTRLIGAYGPTETAVQVLVNTASDLDDDNIVPYEPLPGNIVLVVNKSNQICLVGEPGEIVIGGAQLFNGYRSSTSASNDECFAHVDGIDGILFYRTGDMGSYRPDMRIQILGRRDSQLKVSGMRISPIEIEYALESHPDVLRAGVTVMGGRLHAAVQAVDGKEIDVGRLVAFCKSTLPERLIPTITQVPSVPLLSSMKINRRQLGNLPELSGKLSDQRLDSNQKSLSAAENAVSRLVLEITGTNAADAEIPLKLQGLDSLGFMQLRGLLTQKYGVKASYSDLRQAGNLRSIARLIPAGAVQDVAEASPSPHTANDRTLDHAPQCSPRDVTPTDQKIGAFPALPSQVTMWVAQQRLRDSRYNVQRVTEFKDTPGPEVLGALLQVVSAMDIFRTTFSYQRDSRKVHQVLVPKALFGLEYVMLRDNQDPLHELRTTAKNDDQVFDLEKGPLAKFKVFSHQSSSYVYSNIHHILLDAYTSGKFLEAITRALENKTLDLPSVDAVGLASNWSLPSSQSAKQAALERWTAIMEGVCNFAPAHTVDRSSSRSPNFVTLSRLFPVQKLVPPFECLLSVFLILMHRYTESEDVTVTIPASARGMIPEYNGVLGNLTNSVFIRSRLFSTDTVELFTDRISKFVEFAVDANVPIDAVSSACGLDLQHFSVQFVVHDSRGLQRNPDVVDLTVETLLDHQESRPPKFDLMWHVFVRADSSVQIHIEFDASKHSREWLEATVDCYKRLLTQDLASYRNQHPDKLLMTTSGLRRPIFPATISESGTPAIGSSFSTDGENGASSWSFVPTPFESANATGRAESVTGDVREENPSAVANQYQSNDVDESSKPTEKMEILLKDALRQSLDIQGDIELDQPLRELGLDSFASMSLISNMYAMAPEIEMSIYDIMEYSTVGALAKHLSETHPEFTLACSSPNNKNAKIADTRSGEPAHSPNFVIAPTTYLQRQFFLLQEQLGDTTYSLPYLYKVSPGVSVRGVVDAVKAIADEHDVFRTTFQLEGDEIVQVVHQSIQHSFTVYDLREQTLEAGKEKMRQLCMSDCAAVFDLSTGPLIRCFGFVDASETEYLFLNFHHIIADKQSVSTLVRHIEAISVGHQSVKEIVPKCSGLEVSERQREALQPSRTAAARAFWQGILQTKQSLFGWGILEEDPSLMFEAAESLRHTVTLESDPASWAYSSGATSFGAHLFAFQLLLALRSGASSNSVLIPATCRNPKYGEQEMYGSFINTLPVPLRLSEASGTADLKSNLLSFNSRLGRVLSYSHIPFQMIMDMTGRTMGDFDIMFVYHEITSSATGTTSGHSILEPAMELLPSLPGITAKFPVTFSMTKIKDVETSACTLKMYVEYNPSLVSEEDAKLVCRQFERLLRVINTANGDIDISSLETVLSEDGPVPTHFYGFSDSRIVKHDFTDVQILKQARKTPGSTAVVFEDSASATYQQLSDMIGSICTVIQSSMVSSRSSYDGLRGAKICIIGDVSVERLAALISIMHLGAAYIPIDLKNPLDWNAKIIGDCEPACMVFMSEEPGSPRQKSAEDLLRHFTKGPRSIPCVRIPSRLPAAESFNFGIDANRRDSDLAYVLYTSGSTGVPKGVAIPHNALKNSLDQHRRVYLLSPECKLLGLAPWTFDVSVMDMFGPLSVGATLVIGGHDYLFSDLSEVVRTHAISHISTTPTVASLMHPDDVPTIEMLALGGEPMTKIVRDTWADRIALMNVYGPTEATVDVIWRRLKPDTPVANIGRPFTNVFVYILDDSLEMKQVAVGETGQLALGGVQLARGYIRDPPGRPSPFIEHGEYGRLYLTGDLAKFNTDGTVQCLGRMDTMVNIRGLRVELGAIEEVGDAVLVKRGGKCVVLKAVRRNGQETLVALFDADGEGKSSVDTITPMPPFPHGALVTEMQNAVLAKLPSYFLPSFWIPVEEFPRNKNQKLDRKAVQGFVDGFAESELAAYHLDTFTQPSGSCVKVLPNDITEAIEEVEVHAAGTSSVEAFTHSEQLVIDAFKKILGTAKTISRDANFFTVGGDSISAIRVCTAIRAGGKNNVRVRDLYVNPTVEALARFINSSNNSNNNNNNNNNNNTAARPHLPTNSLFTPTPVMDWFLRSRRAANMNWFNQGHAIKLTNGRKFLDFVGAWNRIIEVHPMLRMKVDVGNSLGEAMVGYSSYQKDDFKVVHKRMRSLAEFQQETQAMQGSLDITNGPVSGIVGEFQDGEETYCSVIVHHMAIDIVSWHIIWEDLEQVLKGRDIEPELSSFKDWACELSSRKLQPASSGQQQQKSFNSMQVNNFFKSSELLDMTANNTNASGAFLNVKIPGHVLAGAERYAVDAVDFILAGLVLALRDWRAMAGVELCFESHGRDLRHEHLDLTRTVGWFTYMVPILFAAPSNLSGSTAVRAFIQEVSRLRTETMQNVNFAEPILHSQAAPYAATFNYLGRNSHGSSYLTFKKASRIDMGSWEDPSNVRPFVFDFESSLDNDCINVGVFYSSMLHSDTSMKKLLGLWDTSLRSLAAPQTLTESIRLPHQLQAHRSAVEVALGTHRIDHAKVEQVVPATDMQAAMLLASIGSRAYMHSYDYTLQVDDVYLDRFCTAWEGILKRHSIFRTLFVPISGVPNTIFDTNMFQVVLNADAVPVADFVIREPPPHKFRAAYGQLLSKVFIYTCPIGEKKLFRGTPPPTLGSQFSDVALHQHSHQKDQLQFWRSYMQNIDSDGGIFIDHSKDAAVMARQPLDRQHRIRLNINPDKLAALASSRYTSMLALYRAAWALVVSAYNSSEDVVFGTITAGRAVDVPGIDKVVGPCLNNTPVRVRVDWSQTLEHYIDLMSQNSMDVTENEGVSLRNILGASGKKNAALFNSTLMFPFTPSRSSGDSDQPSRSEPGFKLVAQDRDEVTDLPILLTVEGGVSVKGTIVLSLRSHGRDFSDKYLLRLMHSFGRVLESFASFQQNQQHPRLHEIDILGDEHKNEIEKFATGPEYPSHCEWTSWELLEHRVQESPDATAVEFWHTQRYPSAGRAARKVTYRELKDLAELGAGRICSSVPRLANRGRTKVGESQRIALFLDKSIELVAGILATHRLDCAYVPIDMESPSARISSLMEAIQPAAVLCARSDKHALPDNLGLPILLVEDIFGHPHRLARHSQLPPPPSATLSNLAAILFTSGTTGTPKGVKMSHRQVVGYGVMMAEALQYKSTDRIFGFARPVFDVSQSDLFGSIVAGATLILAPHGETMARLVPLLKQVHATTTNVTPSVASLLKPDMLPDMRCLALAGEKATEAVIKRWTDTRNMKKGRKTRLVNAYGPTEAVVISFKECSSGTEARCVGSPAVGMQVRILDQHMRSVPIGARGTIWCSGRQLSDGYFGRDEATKAAFKENPFGQVGGLIYNTGDMGAYNFAGEINYFSRNDRQVKLNGRRVELSEIENALSGPDVYVSVLLHGQGQSRQKPIAFHSAKTGSSSGIPTRDAGAAAEQRSNSVRQKAKQSLPQFMIPHEFVAVSEMPLTGNGKVDQKKLQQLFELETSSNSTNTTGDMKKEAASFSAPDASSTSKTDVSNCFVRFPSPALPALTGATSAKPNIFALFAITGVSVQYRQLASYLPRHSLIGIDNLHLSDANNHNSIPAMATHYATAIRSQQQEGPYLLLGFSFAAHVAWETGRVLLAQVRKSEWL